MRATLKRRLDKIEKEKRKLPTAAPCPSVAPLLEARLASFGIVRRSEESLAETTARAMGISVRELRIRLELLACGSQK
jgi:hypothetical protein